MKNAKHRILSLLCILLLLASVNESFAQVIKVTKKDSLLKDVNNNMKADPGDSLRYITKIIVSGASATGVMLDTMNFDSNLTINPNYHIAPLARQDEYDCTGDVGINVLLAAGLLANDIDIDNNAPSGLKVVKAGDKIPDTNPGTEFTTSQGGKVTVQITGAFTYDPAAAYTGMDTFYYELTDGDAVTPNQKGRVIITISDLIWFVDNSSGGTGGTGTLSDPFKTMNDFNISSGPGNNDNIYLAQTATTYSTGIILKSGQVLIGAGTTGTDLATEFGVTLPPHSNALPLINNAVSPIIKPTLPSDEGITLAMNTTIKGVDVKMGMDKGIYGTGSLGTVTISEVFLENNAVEEIFLENAMGTMNMDMSGIICAVDNAITITGGSINITFTKTTLTHSSGNAIAISGHSGTISYENDGVNSISQTSSGTGLNFSNCSGTYSIDNLMVSTGSSGTGISITNSPSGSFNFGDVSLMANTGITVTGTGAGTIIIDGTSSINSTNGPALNLINATSASNSLTFGSASSTSSTSNGINLDDFGGTLDINGGTIMSSASNGINILGALTGTVSLDDVAVSSPTAIGVNINGDSGGADQITGTIDFNNVDVSAISAAPIISIAGINTSGTVDFDSNSSITSSSGGGGIVSTSNAAGSSSFNGPVTLTTNTSTGVNLTTNGTHTFNFNGGLNVTTTTGTAFNTTGGGTVNVTGSANTINVTGSGRAVVMNGITIGASDVTFSTINSTGTGANAPVADVLSFTNVSNFGTFNGGAVNIADTNGSSDGINIGSGSANYTFTSATIANAGGDGIAINGSTGDITFTTIDIDAPGEDGVEILNYAGVPTDNFTISGGTIDDTGQDGVRISNATSQVNIGSLTIDDTGSDGVSISGSSGTINVTNTTIGVAGGTGTTGGNALDVDGGAGTLTVNGSILNTAGKSVEVTGRSGGIVNIGSNITDTGTGVNLNANSTGTVNFSGGLNLNTGANTAFNATTSGSVNVTGTNTIGATTALSKTAINIADVTIGSSGVTFQSIDVDQGSTSPDVPAIILDDTGTGSFTVTGNGTTDGSGGTLEDILEDAVRLRNTDGSVTLKNMNIEDIGNTAIAAPGHHGIDGQQVDGGLVLDNVSILRMTDSAVHGEADGGGSTTWNGLTIEDSKLENSNRFHISGVADGGGADEAMVTIEGISGTVSITGNDFDDGPGFVNLLTASSGTLDVTIQSNTFDDARKDLASPPSVGGSGVRINTRGTIDADIRIGDPMELNNALGNTFINGGSDAAIIISGFEAADNADIDLVISRNTSTVTDHTSPGGTPIFDFPDGGIGIESRGSGTFEAIVSYNTLVETQYSGGLETGSLRVDVSGDDTEVIVRNNTIDRSWDAPIFIRADNADGNGANGKLLIKNNMFLGGSGTIGGSGDDLGVASHSPFRPNRFQVRNGAVLDLTVDTENMITHDLGFSGFNESFDFRINGDVGANQSTFNIHVKNSQGPEGFLFRNDDSDGGTPSELNLSAGSSGVGAQNNINSATGKTVLDGNENSAMGTSNTSVVNVPLLGATTGVNVVGSLPPLPDVTAPLKASSIANLEKEIFLLTVVQVRPILELAKQLWMTSELSEIEKVKIERAVTTISKLPSEELANTFVGAIRIDNNAAGHGWFIDPTPFTNEEFELQPDGQWKAKEGSNAEGKMDLLTVLLHELGHINGKNHGDSILMEKTLEPGVRKLPTDFNANQE